MSGTDVSPAGFLPRVDAVAQRLADHARRRQQPPQGLTSPDAETGERWDTGQIWAHLAEIVPYWIAQTTIVIDSYAGEPVPFGRVKSDPGRVRAIEDGRSTPIPTQWAHVERHLASLRTFVEGVDEASWSAQGLHSKRGVMPVTRIVDDFLISHLEEHADQLDQVSAVPR